VKELYRLYTPILRKPTPYENRFFSMLAVSGYGHGAILGVLG
jgi:hypothetical protein